MAEKDTVQQDEMDLVIGYFCNQAARADRLLFKPYSTELVRSQPSKTQKKCVHIPGFQYAELIFRS